MDLADSAGAADPRAARVVESLACTVRGCGAGLALRARALVCPAGHAFDVARRGWVNLLQPQDRRSLAAGDSAQSLAARARLWRSGRLEGLLAGLCAAADRALEAAREGSRPALALDVGCGLGDVLAAVAAPRGAAPELAGLGLDLARAAVDGAARDHPELAFAVANADRRLPLRDASCDLALSVAAPKNPLELARVLRPGARLLLGVPGPEDLIELRAELGGEARREDRAAAALERFAGPFELCGRERLSARSRLDRAGIADVLAASYRGARHAQAGRRAELAEAEVTFELELLTLALRPHRP